MSGEPWGSFPPGNAPPPPEVALGSGQYGAGPSTSAPQPDQEALLAEKVNFEVTTTVSDCRTFSDGLFHCTSLCAIITNISQGGLICILCITSILKHLLVELLVHDVACGVAFVFLRLKCSLAVSRRGSGSNLILRGMVRSASLGSWRRRRRICLLSTSGKSSG